MSQRSSGRLYHLAVLESRCLHKALLLSLRVIDNGRQLEKLRHHRHPRGRRDYIAPKEPA